jgi:transcriptional regulator with XRE-family HTH domain
MANMKRQRTLAARLVGKTMKALREERSITQRQVAKTLGTHPTNVSHIEAGRQDLTVTQLDRVARRLGVLVADLVAPLDHGRSVAAANR